MKEPILNSEAIAEELETLNSNFASKFASLAVGTNLSTVTESGLYYVPAGCSNGYSGDPHFMIVIGGARAIQICFASTVLSASFRIYNNGWGNWGTISVTT